MYWNVNVIINKSEITSGGEKSFAILMLGRHIKEPGDDNQI